MEKGGTEQVENGAAPSARIIVIQIDGLGHDVLALALRRHLMPFTRRLLRKHHYAVISTRTGVPASTPVFQTGMMYGARQALAGFRWFEKATGRVRVMKNYEDIGLARARLPEERGLFRGGAAYCAFFSGGAERAYFTPGQANPGTLAGPLGLLDLPRFALNHLLPAARVAGLSVYELWLELLDWLGALRRGEPRRGEGLFPFERVAANAVLREICTLGVISEIRRGTPAVFVNYAGYDVMAHHRGPRSFSAMLALAAIDRKIRKLWRAAVGSGRNYEFFILSDHGQTATVPFERVAGRSLRQVIVEHQLAGTVAEIGVARFREMVHSVSVLGHLRQMAALLPWPFSALAAFAARRIDRRLARTSRQEVVECAADLVIMPTSGLAHLYFRRHPGGRELADIEREHPGLVARLASLHGVRAVVGRSGGRVVIRGPEGELRVGDSVELTGSDPLAGVGQTEAVARELAGLAGQEESGDLIVLAGKVERVRRLRRQPLYANFQDELGGHGGVEPPEQNTFLIAPGQRAGLFEHNALPHQLYAGLSRVRWGAAET